jgi:hypothetical protein
MVSHAGAPLVIWDRRFLDGGPVATPQLVLDNYTRNSYSYSMNKSRIGESGDFDGGGTVRGLDKVMIPERVSNALYLSCYGSMLAGRADNGEIGVWDLSNILGWYNENNNKTNISDTGGGGGSDLSKDVSDSMGTLKLVNEPSIESFNSTISVSNKASNSSESSNWKRPVFRTFVPMATTLAVAEEGENAEDEVGGGDNSGMVVRPRAEVWIGPDWLAATGQGRLHYLHL